MRPMFTFTLAYRRSRPAASVAACYVAMIPALLALPASIFPAVQLWREEGASWFGDAGWWTLGLAVVLALLALVGARLALLWFGRFVLVLSAEGIALRLETLGVVWLRRFYPAESVKLLVFNRGDRSVECVAELRGGGRVTLAEARRPEELVPLRHKLGELWPGKMAETVGREPLSGVQGGKRARFPWWLLLFGLVLTGMGCFLLVQHGSMIAHGYRVDGRVVRVATIPQQLARPPYNSWNVYAPVVRFMDPDGHVHEAQSVYRSGTPMRVGVPLPGYWNPADPGAYLPVDAFALFVRPGFFLVPGLLTLALLLSNRLRM